jgi:hypothetical protein
MQKFMESRQKIFTILQVKSHFLCTLWVQKSWLARLARLARLAIFLHGWRLTLRAKFRGWRGAARLAETSNLKDLKKVKYVLQESKN